MQPNRSGLATRRGVGQDSVSEQGIRSGRRSGAHRDLKRLASRLLACETSDSDLTVSDLERRLQSDCMTLIVVMGTRALALSSPASHFGRTGSSR